MEKDISMQGKRIILTEDPLFTKNINLLEKILMSNKGRKYLIAIQFGSLGGNYGIFTNSDSEPINEYLPGGVIIRQRYSIKRIKQRYNFLKSA